MITRRRLHKHRTDPFPGVALGSALSLAFAAALAAGPINVENPPQGRFSDEWAEIFIGGAKSGYAHSTMARDGDEIQTETRMKLRIGRAGQNIDLSVSQESVETVAGRPLRFASVMDMSLMKTSTRGTVADGRVTLVSSQYGMEQTQTFDYPKEAIMTWGAFRESVRRGFKPGTKYTIPMYAPDLRLDGAVEATTAIGDWETFTHRGKEVRGQRVTLTLESPLGSVEMLSWVDEHGSPRKAKVPIPGLADLEIVTTDQKTAVSEFVPPEIFMTTVIRSPHPLNRERMNRIRYRLTNRSEKSEAPDLPATDMQKILGKEGRSIELEVRRMPRGRAEKASPEKLSSAMSEFLDSNLILNTADPILIELAKQAGGGETDAFALADRLRRFVTDFVSNKSMNVGFATASEVARSREGDCSEHGVLLAALGRLNGLPSRVVVGLAYAPFFGGENDIFGYHLWTQFFIDGKWYDYDAALRESDVSPARIVFATSSLKNAGLAELSFGMLSTIGDLSLEFLDVDSAEGKD